jgi:integrase/recombinase XerD
MTVDPVATALASRYGERFVASQDFAASQATGITKRVSPHTLRHSFATHLLEQNVGIRVIQVLLEHAKLETTALYTRVAVNTIRDVTSPLDRLGVNLARRPPPA